MKYIYDLIKTQQTLFEQSIPITNEWEWNFKDHVNTSILYKNSIFKTGASASKPFKNILRPILNLQYRAEGFDVKDITLFIEDQYQYFKAFLVRKFHEKWARENGIDTFIDLLVESYVDFGGALVKKSKKPAPEVVPLQRLAFCDQSDLLSGPICEKHFYSPEELREEGNLNGWNNIEDVIALAEDSKSPGARKVGTPGKYIEVFELHGLFPRYCLYDQDAGGNYAGEYYDKSSPDNQQIRQLQICTFYSDDKGNKQGISLFKGIEKESPYKLILRDAIYGRALGLGGAEELFQDQIWANYGMIRLKQLLDAASKVLYKTSDPAFANRNKTDNLDSGEILVLDEGKDIAQIDTAPRSTGLFDRFVQDWEGHAREMGSATGALLGEHVPGQGRQSYNAIALLTSQGQAIHDYRKGKLATFMDEIYRDWIIPYIVKEISGGVTFMADLDADEMEQIANGLVTCETNKMLLELILNGQEITPELVDQHKQMVRDNFMKGGNRRFIEILKGELKNAPVSIEISIAGKQKDLAGKVDKLMNIVRFIMSTFNPQTGQFMVFNDPRMVKIFNQIIESSDLSPVDFYVPSPAQNSAPTSSPANVSAAIPNVPIPPQTQISSQTANQGSAPITAQAFLNQ